MFIKLTDTEKRALSLLYEREWGQLRGFLASHQGESKLLEAMSHLEIGGWEPYNRGGEISKTPPPLRKVSSTNDDSSTGKLNQGEGE